MPTLPKLLLDENISHRLKDKIADIFPICCHCTDDLDTEASDKEIWQYAKDNAFLILTKDKDFYNMSELYGHPPKVLLLRSGNTNTSIIEASLRKYYDLILEAYNDDSKSLIILSEERE